MSPEPPLELSRRDTAAASPAPTRQSSVPSSTAEPSGSHSADQRRAVRGGALMLAGQLTIQALRMVGQIVLTRLIPTEAFGLMAIVHTFRSAIELCSDVGIAPSIVRDPRGNDPVFLNTAWTLQFFRGLLIFAIASLASGPLADFYGEPALAVLVPAASTAALIAGMQSVKVGTAERNLRLGRLILIEVASQVAALGTMLVVALLEPSVWALVAGALVGATVDLSLNHLWLPGYTARFGWDRASAASLVSFGRWVFISTVLTFAVTQSDRLIFGKMITLSELGVYHTAAMISQIPLGAMDTLARKVIFPLISRAEARLDAFTDVVRKARRVHLVISGWVLSGLIGGAPAAIGLIYDHRYAEAGWMLRWLAIAGWLSSPEATNSAVCLAKGQARWLAAGNLAKLAGMVTLLPLGYALSGFQGALIAYAGTGLGRYVVSTLAAHRFGLRTFDQDLGYTLVVVAASGGGALAVRFLSQLGVHVAVQCLAVFVLVTGIWSPMLWPYVREKLPRRTRTTAL